MKDRIKCVRKHLNMTQDVFAKRIGVKRNTVAQYETGRNPPIDSVITLICREFGVDEAWLRTGVGEMFHANARKDAITRYMAELSTGSRSDLEQLLIEFMAETTAEEWSVLAQVLRRFAEKMQPTE